MSASTKPSPQKRIYTFSGDTVAQRKRQAYTILTHLGFQVQLKNITQTKGTLFISWDPPFTKEDFQRLDRLARYAAVLFVPAESEPQLACIHVMFEREPGLHFTIPALQQYHPITDRSKLDGLLLWHSTAMQARQSKLEKTKERLESTPEPEQHDLWENDEEE